MNHPQDVAQAAGVVLPLQFTFPVLRYKFARIFKMALPLNCQVQLLRRVFYYCCRPDATGPEQRGGTGAFVLAYGQQRLFCLRRICKAAEGSLSYAPAYCSVPPTPQHVNRNH
jgi:hypothetical protein